MAHRKWPRLKGMLMIVIVMFSLAILLYSWFAAHYPEFFVVFVFGFIIPTTLTILLCVIILMQCLRKIEISSDGVQEISIFGQNKQTLSWDACKEVGLYSFSFGSDVMIYFSPSVLTKAQLSNTQKKPKMITMHYTTAAMEDILRFVPKSEIRNHHIIDQIEEKTPDHF